MRRIASKDKSSKSVAKPAPPEVVQQRMNEVVDIISSGSWRAALTARELGKRWGVAKSTVDRYYQNALMYIRQDMGDPDTIRTEIAVRCDDLIDRAINRIQLRVAWDPEANKFQQYTAPDPDVKGATAALKLRAQVLGVLVHKYEHEVDEKRKLLAGKSTKDMAEIARMVQDGLHELDELK